MNERPPQNRSQQGRPPQGEPTGVFKVNIDQSDLMTAAAEPSRRARADLSRTGQFAEPHSVKKAALTDKERKAERRAHRKRNRVKARKNKWLFSFVWLCMVLLLSFTLSTYLIGGSNDFFAAERNPGAVDITIPEGKLTEDDLAEILYKAGAIDKPEFFSLYCKITADIEDFEPGTRLQVGTNLDYEDLINTLIDGNETLEEVQITFPEGSTALQIANLLEENEVCSAQDFLNELNNGDYTAYNMIGELGDTSGKYYKLEGYLFPDTYNFYKDEDLDYVIGKMLNNFQRKMSDKLKARVEESGMTMDQIITIASIIQAEAAGTTDMFNVSAVLHNRLSFGADYDIYNLECDSTSFYPYKNAKERDSLGGSLSYGAYDTYVVEGLPAGAICNPGIDAINAALKPNTEGEASEYLYFCHSEDGEAYYATNSWDHEVNKELAGLS